MLLGLASAVLKVAFYHKTFDDLLDIGVLITAVNYVLGNTYLLEIFLAGVVVICVNYDSGIYEI